MNVMPTVPILDQRQDLAFSFFSPVIEPGEMVVTSFAANEGLFSLTEVEVELSSHNPDIDLHALVDVPATVSVHHKYEGLRHFSGVVAAASRGNEGHRRTAYKVTILPMLHRLRYGSDCRIFQQKSVPDIIKTLLAEHGVNDVQWALTGEHVAREYCVQYRENHLDFIERLAAEEGIWYFFSHGEKGQHTLIFCDNHMIAPNLETQPELDYNANAGGAVKGTFCNHFTMTEQVKSTAFVQRDYTFKNPPYNQQHQYQSQENNGSGNYEMYDYPGRYKKKAAGKPFTQYRMEAARVDATTASGRTNSIFLTSGYRFDLTSHPKKDYNVKYMVRRASHVGLQPGATEEDSGGGTTSFSTNFNVQPARLPYRPPQKTKPLVDGPQVAHVTGPPGEEIYCDEFGRVKIWFPWDRHGTKDDKSSCWVRVAQSAGGGQYGHVCIPRIGHEVVVDFLEGDPDQPIVRGVNFNPRNMPPYPLPDNKTKMVLRSQSHKAAGSNEIAFEDEGGKEEMFIKAQYDQNQVVGNNRTSKVAVDQAEEIGNNKSSKVVNDHKQSIGNNQELSVAVDQLGSIGNNQTLSVGVDKSESVGVNSSLDVGSNQSISTGVSKSDSTGVVSMENVGVAKMTNIGAGYMLTVGAGKMENVGAISMENVGLIKTVTAGTKIVLSCGSAEIVLSAGGAVEINGTSLNMGIGGPVQINGTTIDLN